MKKIIQFWDAIEPPPLIAERMCALRRLNPDWEYICYDRDSAANWVSCVYGIHISAAFLDIRFPAMMADVFRVAYILASGGIWMDAATICSLPLSKLLNLSSSCVVLRRQHMQPPLVWNGLIYAKEPGHPFLFSVWQKILQLILERKGSSVWGDVGPGLFRDILAEGKYDEMVSIVNEGDVAGGFIIGSSSEAMPRESHWSERRKQESLYLSLS